MKRRQVDAVSFAAWRETVREQIVDLDCARADDGPFHASISSCDLLGTRIAKVAAGRHHVSRDRRRIASDHDEYVLLTVLVEGRVTICQGSREARLQVGDMAIYDSTRPYDFFVEEPFVQTVLRLSRKDMARQIRSLDDLTACPISGTRGTGRLAARFICDLEDQLGHIDPRSAPALHGALIDLVGAAFTEQTSDRRPPLREQRHVLMTRIVQFVDTHFCEETLTCERVAETFGLSERYLRKLFAESERSLSERIWHLRLEKAKRDLRGNLAYRSSVTSVAYDCGFKDPAHFSRAFKEKYGMTPRDYARG
ncbi:AraC-like DNA-binding protein [Sphingomonas sp. SORGH_AS 950]|uniref:AraC-like ligand-binding domain-containing protein n=1 Tax=Sphingomonas sp. SORGH_AS_0950 TaxID=3041792 RepID=UPI002780CB62|nr:helix-turn-helix domain-containing protein [Sphingomonas sp. SORGH_AS_0950]MDQ1159303.1 AraC-like DNA-binding protein [Sphingomonas sp. SORGH_AS_0950]